jgi:hypothetical protein
MIRRSGRDSSEKKVLEEVKEEEGGLQGVFVLLSARLT